jgi:hypothetical protein
MNLPIESGKNDELLKKYGLAVLLHNTIEYLILQHIIFCGGLSPANIDVVDEMLNRLPFDRKLTLFKKLSANEQLIKDLARIKDDRNLLAHGVNMQTGDVQQLSFNKQFHKLTDDGLTEMIDRAKKAMDDTFEEFKKGLITRGMKLKQPLSKSVKLSR